MEEIVVKGGGYSLSSPFNNKVWPQANRENLILAIDLTFAYIRPWKVGCERNLQEV